VQTADELSIKSAIGKDIGRKRKSNEDFVAFFEPGDAEELRRSGRLYIVADGVGGAAKGEKASQYAAEKVLFDFFNDSEPDLGRRLKTAIRAAGNEIYEHMKRKGGGARMATTMVAAAVRNGLLTVANVGDSRAYLIRDGKAHQITRDHTIAGELLRNGEIVESEAQRVRGKNRLTRSLGGEHGVHVDIFPDIPLMNGDRIVLCSDGITRYALREDITRLASEGNPDQIVQRMIQYANECGGTDNISIAAVEIASQVGPAAATVRKGTIPAAVDWDEMETQPISEPLRFALRTGKLHDMFTREQWIILGVIAVALIGVTSLLVLSLVGGGSSGIESDATEVNETEASPFPTLITSVVPIIEEPGFETTSSAEEGEVPLALTPENGIEASPEPQESNPEEFIGKLKQGAPSHSDDFTDLQRWMPPKYSYVAQANPVGERLELKDIAPDGVISWSFTEINEGNFYVELEVEMGECIGKDAFAIMVRVDNDKSQGYAVEFSCDGNFRVRLWESDDEPPLLQDWEASSEINQGSNSNNRVGILADDEILSIVANGKFIGSVPDSTYSSGGLSLYVNAIETPGLTAYFDNLNLWRLE
jgi:serine/threonine protein phosphatase PrpC